MEQQKPLMEVEIPLGGVAMEYGTTSQQEGCGCGSLWTSHKIRKNGPLRVKEAVWKGKVNKVKRVCENELAYI